MHAGHAHAAPNGNSYINGQNGNSPATAPMRTTSTFTTSSEQPDSASSTAFEPSQRPSTSESGWGGYSGSAGDGFNAAPAEEGFGASHGDDGNAPSGLRRALGTAKSGASGVEELVTVNVLEEKEGMFLFQHRNYEVASVRRNSKVIRRYSDFVWLLDCLHKRYPFRQLPLLPPKRVASKSHFSLT